MVLRRRSRLTRARAVDVERLTWTRRLATGFLSILLGLMLFVTAACSGPRSSGGLWAEQNLEQEAELFRSTDAQRAERAHAFEIGLADEALGQEQARLRAELSTCPGGARQPLALSAGDRVRDTIRVRVYDDPGRITALAGVALADWRLRRGLATGAAHFCDEARSALVGEVGEPATSHVLEQLGEATVRRDPEQPTMAAAATTPHPPPSSMTGGASRGASRGASHTDPLVGLSLYAVGWTDTLTANAPLPQYLAAVYGGVVIDESALGRGVLHGREPAMLVDEIAPAYPQWEPDALYVTFGGTR